jgi:hypothetical protein
MNLAVKSCMNSLVVEPHLSSFQRVRETTEEVTTLPLDDFLMVQVAQTPNLRSAVREFLQEHCARPRGLSFVAARGKLVAEFVPVSAQKVSFGEVVKQAREAVKRSEFKNIRAVDPRDLARALCSAA